MVQLTFYGGAGEIGGNKILLEDKDAKIFLDFGMGFKDMGYYFSEFLQPRIGNGLNDYLELGIVPWIKGFYNEDIVRHSGINDMEKNEIDGILVSHAHADHIAMFKLIRPSISIYCSEDTYKIMDVFDNAANSNSTDYLSVGPKFQFYKNNKGELSRADRKKEELVRSRNIIKVEYEKAFKIKHLEVMAFRVDHSLPGATAYIIETSIGNIGYTGDLRFHGRHIEESKHFVEMCKLANLKVLITEGTRTESDTIISEQDVEKEISSKIKAAKGLVIATYPARDLDRIETFYNAAKKAGRKLIVDFKQYYLLSLLSNKYPEIFNNVLIYLQPKSWHLINKDGFDEQEIGKDYAKWEREFLTKKNTITSKELSKNQSKYVYYLSPFSMQNLIDIKPIEGSIRIRSTCEPFDDEMELDEERVIRWFNHFGITDKSTYQIHCSGHASYTDLKWMIKEIRPEIIIPIHTLEPHKFKELGKKVIIPKKDEKIEIK